MTRLDFYATWSLILAFCATCWLLAAWEIASILFGVPAAGYSRLDPLAASLSTAQRVVQDGGWHEWVTGPGCGL